MIDYSQAAMNYFPETISEAQSIIRQGNKIMSQGGCTKDALSSPNEGFEIINIRLLSGIMEYIPEEFTFSALAGTRISEVNQVLLENHQYLPFDPPFRDKGATLGGTIAAGLSGPGRFHFGGIRDFILGVKYIDFEGELIGTGAKVVKNSAGFNLSKLMVGSLGAFGVIAEVTFKVFPTSPSSATLSINFPNLNDGLEAVIKLSVSHLDLDAIELVPEEGGVTLWVRITGISEAIQPRVNHLMQIFDNPAVLSGEIETELWENFREFSWVPAGWKLIKVPIVPSRIVDFEKSLKTFSCKRHYSCAGQIVWLAVEGSLESIDRLMTSQALSGLVITGETTQKRLGINTNSVFLNRIKQAMDPVQRFVEL